MRHRLFFAHYASARTSRVLTLFFAGALLLFAWAPPASAHKLNTLHDTWKEQPGWSQDTTFVSPDINQHSESTTVYFQGQWLMFHRERNEGSGIAISTSSDGNSWTYQRTVIPGNQRIGGLNRQASKVYAPKVYNYNDSRLVMVYEAGFDGGFGCKAKDKAAVAITETDVNVNGTNLGDWKNHRVLVRSVYDWEGKTSSGYCGNVGTPTITKAADGFYVGYHGSNGGPDRPSPVPPTLRRGVVFRATSDPTTLTISNVSRPLGSSPMQFTFEHGTGDMFTTPEYGVGVGAADITQLADRPWEGQDSAFYMVYEAFQGDAACSSQVYTMIAIARAFTPKGPWAAQDQVLLGQKQGCWRDMPAWAYDGALDRYRVVLTDPIGGSTADLYRITLNPNTYTNGQGGGYPNELFAGERLLPPDMLRSMDARFEARMQTDGNFVLYQPGNQGIWASSWCGQTSFEIGHYLIIQPDDGNLVNYKTGPIQAAWASSWAQSQPGCPSDPQTGFGPGYRLVMQNDGNLVVYDTNQNPWIPRWSTNTCCR